MSDVALLVWLAVIATGSQLIAVVVMWRLQRRTQLEIFRLMQSRDLSPEERLARLEEEARIGAEASADAAIEVLRATQANVVRDEIRRAFEERDRG